MLRIEQIRDLETAKQVARLLEHENARLHTRLEALTRELAAARGQTGSRQLELEVMKLQEQMRLLQHRLFGPSSEQRSRGDEPPAPADASPDEPEKPTRGHGPRPQPALPVVEVVHELDEADRVCDVCGGPTVPWDGQFDEADEVTVVERRFVLHRHTQQKHRCRCGGPPVTAPGPRKLIPGGRYSVEFAVEVAIDKYLDHLPLERQVRRMGREGLVIDSQTLWDQIEALARHLRPTYEALWRGLHEQPVVHADETPWPLLQGRPAKRWYVWCLAAPTAVYYRILPSRSADAGGQMLAGYQGIVVVDGYKAYETLARASPGTITLVHCWAHVRRKFVEAARFYPDECQEVLERLGQLYGVERQAPDPHGLEGDARDRALALRARLRHEQSRALVEQIRAWALAQRALPESTLRKAIEYMRGLWPGLVRFLDDPRIPLDNNHVERELRGTVVGRKNHYGSKSRRGTEVAALFYSLVETAKLQGVNPKAYLLAAARMAIESPGTVFLPSQMR